MAAYSTIEVVLLDGFQVALHVEEIVLGLPDKPTDDELKAARLKVRSLFQSYADVSLDKSLTLAETIEKISAEGLKKSLRNISILVLRLSAVSHFFPKQSIGSNTDAKIISLIEPRLSDFYKRFDIDEKDQTYVKLDKLYEVHGFCIEKLKCLQQIPANVEAISTEKQIILRSLGDKTLKAYLSIYEFEKMRSSIEVILTQIVEISTSADATFNRKLKELLDLLHDEIEYCDTHQTFVTKDYYAPFLRIIAEVVDSEAKRSKERFKCEIRSRKGSGFKLDKKYPLNREDEEVRLYIPLFNTGPGIADRVIAHVNTKSESILVHAEEIDIGGVAPGDFVVPVSFSVCEPTSKIVLEILVSWMVIGNPEEELFSLSVTVEAQKNDIDWDSLVDLNPYSLDIATGDNFHGRKDRVAKLVSRTTEGNMQSSYITGQRRVGKSSLAKAVEDRLKLVNSDCQVLNIECGDFKHPDAISTVNALGESISNFLSQHLPHDVTLELGEMNGSLAPLSKLTLQLERLVPNKRFLIIIDEFDEINQELYRSSEIAETFFLNLRSLSGKKNICFCLVGAERMSFVMSSQGEKLNKFSRESLNNFKQDEWLDYEELVKAKIYHSITWLDNAIRSVYTITNGHPYFTKQVCSKVFDNAVSSRDAEISDEEVILATNELIPEIDVNSFQHFWRDGIQGDLDEVDILAIKRCRVLVGFARVRRLNLNVNVDNLKENIHSNQISESDILPILTDFCRRGIMVEEESGYKIEIPLFDKWLINQGFNTLIADQFGDELAEKRQKVEDEAYVNDIEIADLLASWPDYRGVQFSVHLLREWLTQVPSHLGQRMLFKLLCNIRFFGEAEVRAKLKTLHEKVRRRFPVIVQKSKVQRRKDIWITYIDGPSKSGAQFASYYAEENLISTTCIKEIAEMDSIFQKKGVPDEVAAIIIVDDFIGSGRGLSSNISGFYERNGEAIANAKLNVLVTVLCATSRGEEVVRDTLSTIDENADLFVCETLESRHYAFSDGSTIWNDTSEMYNAKEICQRLGTQIDKSRPLGYEDQGLLVVFSRNCPNNTLPILHSSGRGGSDWRPLFERIKH